MEKPRQVDRKVIMKGNGAVDVQTSKAWEYLPSRELSVASLERQIKAAVEPDGLSEPGSLGL